MPTHKMKLPDTFRNFLINLPESGMGYQTVKIILKDGNILRKRIVLNSEILLLDDYENITPNDIESIELENFSE